MKRHKHLLPALTIAKEALSLLWIELQKTEKAGKAFPLGWTEEQFWNEILLPVENLYDHVKGEK